jgi:hypothetical protein
VSFDAEETTDVVTTKIRVAIRWGHGGKDQINTAERRTPAVTTAGFFRAPEWIPFPS